MHLRDFTELFAEVVRLAREMGLVMLGTIAVDGTKIKANAAVTKPKIGNALARPTAPIPLSS